MADRMQCDGKNLGNGSDCRPHAVSAHRCLNAAEVNWLIWEGVKTLDARSQDEHLCNCLGGSVHVGQRPSRQHLQNLRLDPAEPLICWSNGEKRARALASRLGALGFRSVYVLKDGIEGFLADQVG